jgi:hypothetical protein
MNKHTPGPWAVEDSIDGPIVYSEKTEVIISDCKNFAVPFGSIHEQCSANARLIAAAPELLDALLAIAGDEVQRVNGDLHKKARAAIAKARGELK